MYSSAAAVPWKLMPFLIVVLGVDNMFVLTTAVSATSINLPVKERIAEGLGQCGLSIFVNLVSEVSLLWILYLSIPTRVIREMVVFGGVALLVDYIMEMTYFITVLSIDMQRLELADFLSQGAKINVNQGRDGKASSRKSMTQFAEGILQSFRQRKARTLTIAAVSSLSA